MLTIERLRELLHYNRRTGVWTWRVSRSRMKAGSVAGKVTTSGYRQIKIDGKGYISSNLVSFYVTGEWPDNEVDHRNRKRLDDRWRNLRPAGRSQNCGNQTVRITSKTGVKGVSIKKGKKTKPYLASITVNGRNKHLGYFSSKKAASAVYASAAREFFGEFAKR